jgi:para-nitrobenzyl esterase
MLVVTGHHRVSTAHRERSNHNRHRLVEDTTAPGTRVHAYTGIPFAAPPVGELRWQPPQAVAHWDGVRKATTFGSRCMQGRIFADMMFRDEQSEDCLYLNVWTPSTSARDRLPVMVWICGGGFQAGSASGRGRTGHTWRRRRGGGELQLPRWRVRLHGPSGLSQESEHRASGNYGLMDMIAALRWVKNIAAFGGDRVT